MDASVAMHLFMGSVSGNRGRPKTRYCDNVRERGGIKSIVAIYRRAQRQMESHGGQLCAFRLVMMMSVAIHR